MFDKKSPIQYVAAIQNRLFIDSTYRDGVDVHILFDIFDAHCILTTEHVYEKVGEIWAELLHI